MIDFLFWTVLDIQKNWEDSWVPIYFSPHFPVSYHSVLSVWHVYYNQWTTVVINPSPWTYTDELRFYLTSSSVPGSHLGHHIAFGCQGSLGSS